MEGQSHSESGEGIRSRNATVLLATDVTKRNDKLLMPNTIEMAQIKKEEKGQYVRGIKFSDNMSEEEVKGRILSHFPNLENQRFFCASVVDNRTRLEFHGEPQVWDGQFMKKTLGGNSALYIFTEMTDSEWSRTLPQRPTVTHTQSKHLAEHPTSSHIPTSLRIPTSSHVPTYPLHSNLNSVPIKRKNDQGAQQGLLHMAQPVVSPTVKRKKGNYRHAINQTVPQNQLNKVTTSAQAPVQHLCFPVTQASMQGAVISGPLPFQRLVHLQQNQPLESPVQGQYQIVLPQVIPSPAMAGSFHQVSVQRAIGDPLKMLPGESSVWLQQNQPPEGPVQGQHQIQGIPSPATAGSSRQELIQRAIGYPLKMPPEESSVWFQQNQPLESPVQGQYQIVLPQVIPPPSMAGSSQQVSVQRAIGESSVWLQTDSGCESSKEDCTNNGMCECEESSVQLSDEMTPDWAYTKEEKKFTISFSDPLPFDVTSYRANFEGLGVANLTLKNPYTLVGVNPISQIPREVTVKIFKFTGNDGYACFREDLKFTYKEKMFELLKDVLASQKNRNAALIGLCKGLLSASAGSDDLNAFRLPEAGKSSTTESDDSKSVKLLTLLIYIAAQNNSLQFVDFIFSTSVGKVVFTHYKHNPTLPEDVARANGHPILGNYLENVNKRLSKERIEDKSETVNWLELKHAMEKKQDQPCNDDVQTPIHPESDGNQRDYDADDEVSNSSSPFSEITDPGYENDDHDTTDDNDTHPSNQAKAEKQLDQHEDEGQKIESLFTDDVHSAQRRTTSASEIPRVLSHLNLAIQASEMPPVAEFNLEVTKNSRTPQSNEEPTVPTPSWRLSVPIEATNLGSCETVPVPDRFILESDHIVEVATHEISVVPPHLGVTLPELRDLHVKYTKWNDVQLPIDILLLTFDDNEFLACYRYLDKPFMAYHKDIGFAYFGFMGNSHENKLKITVMKCCQGCAGTGDCFSFVESAVRVLRPKVVFLVGACRCIDCNKTKLGVVVVSSKVTTHTHKIPSSRHICNIMRNVAVNWNPPLKDPNGRKVHLHCGREVLCKPETLTEDILLNHPEGIAFEIGGVVVYLADHDSQMGWIFVKGIKDHINGDQSSHDNRGVFVSDMAASVVANILHNPVIFEDWCHSGEGKKSGKRKNDEGACTAVCKRTKECSATVVSPFGNSSSPMQLYHVNMLPSGPQRHPSTTTTTALSNISSQNFRLSKFSKGTGSQKYAAPVAYKHTRTSSAIVPGQQTQASGSISPSAHPPVSTLSSPHILNFSMQTSVQGRQSQPIVSRAPQRQCYFVQDNGKDIYTLLQLGNSIPVTDLTKLQKQIQIGLDQQHVLENTNSFLLGTTQRAGSNMVTLEPGNVCRGSAPAFPAVGSQNGPTASFTGTIQCVMSGCRGSLPSVTHQRTEEDKPNRPRVVSEVTLDSRSICQRSVPAQSTVASQCGLQPSGILHNDPSQQRAATADPPPISHESDSGWGSIRDNAVGVAIACNSADQSDDKSTHFEIFSSSEDGDSALEGREMRFESQICGGVKRSSGEDHSKESPGVKKVRRSVEVSNSSSDSVYESTFEDASGFDNNTEHSIDSAYEPTTEDASGVHDNTEHSIGKIKEAASRHIAEIKYYLQNSEMDPSEGSSLEETGLNWIATLDQMNISDGEWNEIYLEVLGITLFEPVITYLCPREGPVTGGTQFVICLNVKHIPENLTSLRALFKEFGFADLTPVTEGVYIGRSPASEIVGKVAVTVSSQDGTWHSVDETEFEYHPNVTQELQKSIREMPYTKRNIPLNYETLNPSRSAGIDSAYESTTGDASGFDDSTEYSTGKIKEAASRHIAGIECYLQNSKMDPSEGSSLEETGLNWIATLDQINISNREWNEIYLDVLGITLFEPDVHQQSEEQPKKSVWKIWKRRKRGKKKERYGRFRDNDSQGGDLADDGESV